MRGFTKGVSEDVLYLRAIQLYVQSGSNGKFHSLPIHGSQPSFSITIYRWIYWRRCTRSRRCTSRQSGKPNWRRSLSCSRARLRTWWEWRTLATRSSVLVLTPRTRRSESLSGQKVRNHPVLVGQTWPLFVYFRSFRYVTNKAQILLHLVVWDYSEGIKDKG